MSNLKMILSDSTEIPIEDSTVSGTVIMKFESKEAMLETWNLLTPDKLHKVQIMKEDAVVQTLHGANIIGVQNIINPDGFLTAHFYMEETVTEATYAITDSEYVQAAKILLGEEV